MRSWVNCVFILLTMMAAACVWPGSSLAAQPSDGDIIKAIDDSGSMKRADGSLTVIPPVKVVQRGKRSKDGSWPVKVKFTVTYKMKDGKNSAPTETMTSFRIFQKKDAAGKTVWKAQLGT